jgi:hypothetical protein
VAGADYTTVPLLPDAASALAAAASCLLAQADAPG